MAGTFRSAQMSKEGRVSAWESGTAEDAPLLPLKRGDLSRLTVGDRLRHIAKAIMSYAHWYPGLCGLTSRRLERGSRKCELDVCG